MGETNGEQKFSLNNESDEELGKGLIEPDSEFSGIEITFSMKVSFSKETVHRLQISFHFRSIDFCIG